MQVYDVAVLGSGPGGYVAALRAAMRGAKVCCIEANCIGGTCLNVGCIPTKAMLHASELFASFGRSSQFGFTTTGRPQVDGAKFMQRISSTVLQLRRGVEFLLKKRNVHMIRGRGRLVSPESLVVETEQGGEQIQARSIIIATGARPARPEFLPWESGRILTTDDAATAGSLPESILVIGGGVIGCEFATVYGELGIPTTVIEMLDSLVADLDADASKAVAGSLRKAGVDVLTGSKIVSVQVKDCGVTAKLEDGGNVQAACALVAAGRQRNVENIGLQATGVEMDGRVIRADRRCQTNVPGIYAVGDVAELRQCAHLASRMGIVAADNATGHETMYDRKIVPACVYTHPEVATVGLSQAEAEKECSSVRIGRFDYQASGMAWACGQTDGMVKIVVDAEGDRILGAVIIGQHASSSIQEVALAMHNGLTASQLAETIHPHPTFVEGVGEAAEAAVGLSLHALD